MEVIVKPSCTKNEACVLWLNVYNAANSEQVPFKHYLIRLRPDYVVITCDLDIHVTQGLERLHSTFQGYFKLNKTTCFSGA